MKKLVFEKLGVVLEPSQDGWDSGGIMDQSVIYMGEAGRTPYYMYYQGFRDPGNLRDRQIGVAFSEDGFTWERAPIPVITPTPHQRDLGGPCAFPLGPKGNKTIFLFYSAELAWTGLYYIAFGTATDGRTFTLHAPILGPTEPWEGRRVFKPGIDHPRPWTTEDRWWLLYEGGAARGIGSAFGALGGMPKETPIYVAPKGELIGDPAILRGGPGHTPWPKIRDEWGDRVFPEIFCNMSDGKGRWDLYALQLRDEKPYTYEPGLVLEAGPEKYDEQTAWNPALLTTPDRELLLYYVGWGEDGIYRSCVARGMVVEE